MPLVRRRFSRLSPKRKGAVLVEMALVLPIFMACILGIFEFGRAFMVYQVVINASRAGARRAAITTQANTDVQTAVNDMLTAMGFQSGSFTTSVLVNGTAGTASAASRGSDLRVRVSVPFTSVAVVSPQFLSQATLVGECVMRRE